MLFFGWCVFGKYQHIHVTWLRLSGVIPISPWTTTGAIDNQFQFGIHYSYRPLEIKNQPS